MPDMQHGASKVRWSSGQVVHFLCLKPSQSQSHKSNHIDMVQVVQYGWYFSMYMEEANQQISLEYEGLSAAVAFTNWTNCKEAQEKILDFR